METIIAASRNSGKIREMEAITSCFGIKIISRDEAGLPRDEVEEDGETFEENSFKKASYIMELSARPVIADDSGLVVDCIGGAPGVYSARFAGTDCDDRKNNEKLIDLIKKFSYQKRTGRFVSVITMLYPDGRKFVARGEAEGHLILEEKGRNGFGYDPLFVPLGYDRTFAEMSPEEKNRISHRGKALEKLHGLLAAEDRL